MIHLATPIPPQLVISCSGGPDSMALLEFCRRGKRDIIVLHINHKTPHAIQAEQCVKDYCSKHNLRLEIKTIANDNHSENDWRTERLNFYREFTSKGIEIATAHQLEDAIEWYLFTALHAKPALMKAVDKEFKLIKPFLFTQKSTLIEYCAKNNVSYVVDPTNIGDSNARAIMRSGVIDKLLQIHSGMKTSILKLLKTYNDQS